MVHSVSKSAKLNGSTSTSNFSRERHSIGVRISILHVKVGGQSLSYIKSKFRRSQRVSETWTDVSKVIRREDR